MFWINNILFKMKLCKIFNFGFVFWKGKMGLVIFLVIGRKGVVYVLFILKINCWKLIFDV